MQEDDGYDCFRAMQAELVRLGLESEANGLRSALLAGATGSECLGEAGHCLTRLRANHPKLCKTALAPFIVPCVAAVRAAWRHYR